MNKSLTIIGGESFPGANQSGPSIVTSDTAGFTLDADKISIENFTIHAATLAQGTAAIATAPGFLGSGYTIRGNVLEDERDGLILNTVGGGCGARIGGACLGPPAARPGCLELANYGQPHAGVRDRQPRESVPEAAERARAPRTMRRSRAPRSRSFNRGARRSWPSARLQRQPTSATIRLSTTRSAFSPTSR